MQADRAAGVERSESNLSIDECIQCVCLHLYSCVRCTFMRLKSRQSDADGEKLKEQRGRRKEIKFNMNVKSF